MGKFCLGCLAVLLACQLVFAKGADITGVNEPKKVVISSSTWTAIPSVTTIENSRIAMMVDLDVATAQSVYMIFSSSAVPVLSTGTYSMVYKEIDPAWLFPISKDVYLFGVSAGELTGGATMYIQQLKGEF